ncbi:hypothetical protein KY343_03745 [Candidatus Woesearchaeota archaeon]|nr:hypothetical protein [Candidatus Woesearchaeota archaeon]
MKLAIQTVGKSIGVVKDFEKASLAELGLFMAELDMAKQEIMKIYCQKKNE